MKKTKLLSAFVLMLMLLVAFSVTAFAGVEQISGYYKYVELEDGTIEITDYNGPESTVTLPSKLDGKKVTALGDEVFRANYNTTKVIIPDTVKTLGSTFYQSEVEVVELGSGVKTIDRNAFFCSWGLKKIITPDDNKYFTAVNGILYNKAKTRLVCVPSGKEMDTFKIPTGVKTIGVLAIRDVKMKKLVIPSTVTKIEEYGITTNGVEKITIPGSVETLETWSIHFCNGLKELVFEAGKLKEIPDAAITSCYALERLVIPANVTSIGNLVSCESLKEYVVDGNNKVYASVDGNLFNKNKTQLLKYAPGKSATFYAVPDSVTAVDEWVFYGARNLKSVYFHDTIRKIGDNAYGYSGISKIYFEGAESNFPKSDANAYMDSKITYNCKLYSTIKNLKATQTATTITLNWDKVKGVDGYRVYKYNASTKKYEFVKTTTSNSAKITDLKTGTTYKFRVRAFVKADTTAYGPYTSGLEVVTKPKSTSITDIYSNVKGKAVVKWSNVTGETGFQLYYATSKDGSYSKVKSYEANKLAGSKSSLKSGKTYYFKVRAYKKTDSGTLYSAWSSVKSVKVK